MGKVLIILFTMLFSLSSYAGEERNLGRSPLALLMGDAYTSIAVDEYTLFYNPALLARHKGFSFSPMNVSITASNILKDSKRFSNTGSSSTGFADAAFDFPAHIGINYSPGFKMGRFGLSAIVDNNTNFNLQNKVTPVLDIDYRFDRGFIMGYAHPLFGSYSSDSGGEQLALGMSVKYIQREAIYGSYNLTGLSLLDALSKGSADLILQSLGKINGSGWGADLGLDYVKSSGAQTFSMSLAALDVYTLMRTNKNVNDYEVQTQPMRLNFGTAWSAELGGGFDFTLSADIRNLQEQMEFMRRVAVGFEIGLSPALSLMGGVNAVDNYSYGVKLNTGLIKIFAGFYATEVGEKLQQQESDRFVIYFSLFHFGFDPLSK